MAATYKTSRKNGASRKRVQTAPAKSGQYAQFARVKTATVIDILVERGVLKRQRIPLPEYAKVVAVGKAAEVAEVRGQVGIVLAAANDSVGRIYTVAFPAKQEAFVLHEESLWDTGETVPEDVIYGGGETRRVRVDQAGNGTLVA